MRSCEIRIEGLSAERAIDKLVRGGVVVLGAQKPQKNAVVVRVDGKDCKKAFAILQTSCYNIKKVRSRGLLRIGKKLAHRAGFLVGAALFLCCTLFFQSRVLAIRVTGSGSYLEESVKSILRERGTFFFSPFPRNVNALTADVLALPRVSFCSLSHAGGVLTVTVEVNDENAPLSFEPLLSPVSGTLERLTVVRGTPLFAVGDAVAEGDILVDCYTETEAGRRDVLVIAEALVSYPVCTEYALEREAALRQAYLDYGQMENIHTKPTEKGTLVEGTARTGVFLNLA